MGNEWRLSDAEPMQAKRAACQRRQTDPVELSNRPGGGTGSVSFGAVYGQLPVSKVAGLGATQTRGEAGAAVILGCRGVGLWLGRSDWDATGEVLCVREPGEQCAVRACSEDEGRQQPVMVVRGK